MNIKDLLKVFKESNVLQKIEFADPKILLLVGQGLGIVPNQNHYLKSGLLPEIQLSRKNVNQITKEFKILLNNIGVTQNCILNSFDKNNLSFKCYDNAGDELGMLELHCDNYLKKNVTLTAHTNNRKIIQEYTRGNLYNESLIELSRNELNCDNNNICNYYCYQDGCDFILLSENYLLEISIYGFMLDFSTKNKFKMGIENDIINYLLDLNSLNIQDVYSKIDGMCLDKMNNTLQIEIKKYVRKEEEVILVDSLVSEINKNNNALVRKVKL